MILRNQKSACRARTTTWREMKDAELLHQFVKSQRDQAFAELVRRHGSLVMNVCRNVLQHVEDTEDAFQATFLVLARKAAAIRKHQSVASWLYKVAQRIALRARANRTKLQTRQQHLPAEPGAVEPALEERELANVLDEEIRLLPEKYRAPILMCYLEGHTNAEAARELRCPAGTVKIRLFRARELLRKRLLRRGVALSLGLLLCDWARNARAAAPVVELATATAGAEAGAGANWNALGLPSSTIALATNWCKRLALAKIKLAGALLLTVGLLFGVDQLLQRAWSAPPPAPSIRTTPATEMNQPLPTHQSAGEEFILLLGSPSWSSDGRETD